MNEKLVEALVQAIEYGRTTGDRQAEITIRSMIR